MANEVSERRHNDLGLNDGKWPEVKFINDYAVFMAYLSMAVTGTGMLVFTWSTVVLLGGFVTMLAKEDFWSLTVIALVQTRVFDIFLNGHIGNIGYSFARLREAALYVALPRKDQHRLCSMRGMCRLLVFTILLCPLFALYTFGLFISPGVSVWRLHGTISGQGHNKLEANLKPALVVLYSLSLLQGGLFYYWAISACEEKSLVNRVAQAYELEENDEARKSISRYLRDTRAGCEKDPSFARGRNLVTYAARLMESNAPDDIHSGVRILDMLMWQFNCPWDRQRRRIWSMLQSASSSHDAGTSVVSFTVVNLPKSVVDSQSMMIRNIIGSASSSDAINKLVLMLDSKNPLQEIRFRAMRIVSYFAREIRLDKIKYGIRSISSLLENPFLKDNFVYVIGMNILSQLAKDEDNFRIMSNTDGITEKIVKTINVMSGELHSYNHESWLSIARPGLQLINQFVSASSRSNNARRLREILECKDEISTMQMMLDCQKCKGDEALQKSVILSLTQIISMSDALALEHKLDENELRGRFIKSLIVMFLHGSDKTFKKLAGESLEQLSLGSEMSAKSIISIDGGGIADSFITVVKDAKSKYRKSAAVILEHLWRHYNQENRGTFVNLEKTIYHIPEVLKQVLGAGRSKNPDYRDSFSYYDVEVPEALAALCQTVHKRLTSANDSLLVNKLNGRVADICTAFPEIISKPAADVCFTDLLEEAKQVVEDRKTRLKGSAPPCYVEIDDDYDGSTCCIS